ncbi:hypothetical protein [Lacinutrix chionoecetis]
MKKTSLYIILIIAVFTASWYFLIKDYDYKVTFKTTHAPGTVYSTLIGWNNWEPNSKQAVTTISKKPFSEIEQNLKVSDSIINIKWSIHKESDSITKVTALLKDTEHSFIQKLKVPFTKTDFVKRSINTVSKIRKGLKIHEEEYKVSSVTKEVFPAQNCAYITLSGKLNEKAKLMMTHTIDVMNYIRNNELQLTGHPFLEVTNWNQKKDIMTFDFCFPIAKQDSYPKSEMVKIKTSDKKEAIKTMFNGNYRISDRAWFSLIDYAKNKNIAINELPIEVFLNDPHSGGNELEWEAEVFMPTK